MAMQAFGTPYGPLVAPQVPEGTDVNIPFLTGAQMAMQNNARMRALERQNLSFELREKQLEFQHQAQMDRDQRAIDRLEAQKERWGDLYYLSDLERRRKENQFDTRMEQQKASREAMAAAQKEISDLSNSDKPEQRPGGEQFPYLYGEIINKYGNNLNPKDQLALRNSAGTAHNAAHARDVSTYKLMKQTLDDDVGNQLGYDANFRPDYTGVFHPSSLKAQTKYNWSFKGDPMHPYQVTGVYEVPLKTQSGTRTNLVTPQQLTEFNKRWKDVSDAYSRLTKSRFMNDPEAGVNALGPAGERDPAADEIARYKKAMAVWSSQDPRLTPEQKQAAADVLFPVRK